MTMKRERFHNPFSLRAQSFALGLLLYIGVATCASATTISVSGHQLLVNCSPFLVRGVNYSPVPTGVTTQEWATNPTVCQADFAQMKTMGVNAIRVYFNYAALFNTDGTVNAAMKGNY